MSDEFRDIIRQVKDQVDIVDVIGRTVSLRKAGASWKGKCPFHQEKTPSFNVVPKKGIFHCFGCGAGGSVIDFVMRQERLEFIEALEKLARELGMELPSRQRQDPAIRKQEDELRHSIEGANKAALEWFRDNLLEGRNRSATDYLPKRDITEAISEEFQLGAALDSWDALKSHLMKIGYSEGLLVDAGLCARSENGRVYDSFRNRLMFPILDANGRVVGFGGRALDDDPAKYKNSAETALYKKNRILYALNVAQTHIEKSGYAILCEGYMDVIMAHAHGFKQAVASLGTALTREQAKLIKRYATRTYFLYDGDSAGQKAMLRGGLPLLEAGLDTRVIPLPSEDDPDTFLKREGPDALKKKVEHAREFFDYAVDSHSKDLEMGTLAGQAELVDRLSGVIVAFGNDVIREAAISRLLGRIGGIPREALNRILEKRHREEYGREERRDPQEDPYDDDDRAAPAVQFDPVERGLLKVMLESNAGLDYVRANLRHEWVSDPRLEGWIFYLLDNDGYVSTLLEQAELSGDWPGEHNVVTALLAWEHPLVEEGQIDARQLLFRLHERHQLSLTQEILKTLESPQVSDEERRRCLTLLDNEHRQRIQNSGRHLRTKDSRARREKYGRG